MKGQASLKSFIMANAVLTGTGSATKDCGWALANGEKQPLPDAVEFPWAHSGPCEVWCGSTKVFYDVNCMGNSVGKVSLGGKCSGANMIQAMYIGTHVENWEVYMSCAPIGAGGGGAVGEGAAQGGRAASTGGNANSGSNTNTGGNNQNSGGNGNNNGGSNTNKGGGSNASNGGSADKTGGSSNSQTNTNHNANANSNTKRSFDFGVIGQPASSFNSNGGRSSRSLRVL